MKNKMILKNLLCSILTFISFYKYISLYVENNLFVYLIDILLFILFFIYYYKLDKNIKIDKKYNVFSIILSFILVLGYSYELKSTAVIFFGSLKSFTMSLVKIIGYYLFFKVLIYYFIDFMNSEYITNNKTIKRFNKHPFKYSFIFLLICYGIFLTFYYPGIINYDNANQIKEVLGFRTRYLDAINVTTNSTLTNFNPIVHTIILGGLFKIGYLLNNANFGLFMYTIFQLLIVISIYSYAISFSVKENDKQYFSFIILLILGLIPIFGFYSITCVKDTLYTSFLLLFSIKIYELVKKDNLLFRDFLDLFLISMLVCLFRNNGIFVVLITIFFLLYKYVKKILCLFIIICISYISFNNILLPKLEVSNTSIREVLSVPFQQTARLVKYKDKYINNEDKLIINKVLDYNNLKKDYKEDLADPIKNKFNKDATKEDINNYFKVWFKYLKKYPYIYIDSIINNTYGYFYPYENSWKFYYKLNEKLPLVGLDYHYNKLELGRNILYYYEILIECSPLGILLNIAVISWLNILIFIMLCKNKKYIFMLPSIISIFFCILSPANTYYRYIYPSLVLLIVMFPLIKKTVNDCKFKM